jgi:hypothetical protein
LANTIAEQARIAVQNLQTTLKSYAAGRPPHRFVGQFLDDEGRSSGQYGVYGMGSWVALAEDEKSAIRNEPEVRALTLDCKQELRRLVDDASTCGHEPKASDLRVVIPKMCYAYLGLSRFLDCQTSANQLSGWVAAAQKHDGSWGYLTTSAAGCPEVTALVVRIFGAEQTLAGHLEKAIVYLRGVNASIPNLFLQLYVLNTLVLHSNGSASRDDRRTIKTTVAELLNQAFFNPSQFPNPINFDFNDVDRTRYIRLSTDVILLESLELVSGAHSLYVRGHPGRRVFKHLREVLDSQPKKDGSGHRLTPPSALYLYQSLRPLTDTRQWHGLFGLIEKLAAYAVCSWAFGVNIEWNLIALVVCGIGLYFSIRSGNKVVIGGFTGALIKTFLDTGKSVYNSLARFGRD